MKSKYGFVEIMLELLFITVLFMSLMCAGCEDQRDLSYNTAPSTTIVEYSSGGGLAPLSEDQVSRFRLFGDGKVIKDSAESKTGLMVEGRLTPSEVTKLLTGVEEDGFFRLKSEYFNKQVMDAPSSRVIVNLKDYSKSVTVYAMDVENFARTVKTLMDFPVGELKTYEPSTGYVFVESLESPNVEKDSYQQVSDLLPSPAELQSAGEAGKAIEIDGTSFAKLKQFESDTGKYGIDIIVNGNACRIFPVYKPRDL